MGITDANASAPIASLDLESIQIPTLPLDAHCNLSVSNPVVDYGVMSRWQLEDIGTGSLSPGTRSLKLSVVCPYSRTIILRVEGESSEQGGLRYGERGITRLRLQDAQLDNKAVKLRTVTPTSVITESGEYTLALNVGQQLAPVIQGRLAEGKVLTAQLEIQPVMAESETRVSSWLHIETMLTLILDDDPVHDSV
ncbi:fimbrial protein [Enterobacter cloacae]|uniref:Fimbrial protein n=1 Tax=Enterobacter cloacae TaxID=550 RepID=A0A427KE46_ENTCL|nr:fimbrial protein [Enterobacter cloacae]